MSSTKPSEFSDSSSKPCDDSSASSKPSSDISAKPSEGSSTQTDGSSKPGDVSSKARAVQISVVLNTKVESTNTIDVKIRGDIYTPSVTGCAFMPSGHLVLCDHNNNTVKFLDKSLAIHGSVYEAYPSDVCVVDSSNVIVTFPSNEKFQYIQVFPKLQLGRAVSIGKKGWGVYAAAGQVFITCYSFSQDDAEVRVYDVSGNLKKRLGSGLFSRPHALVVNKAGNKIFVSDFGNHSITCMSTDGNVYFKYTYTNLKSPRKLYLDTENNLIVCGRESDNVCIISADGKTNKQLLSARDGIEKPGSIAYRQMDSTLILGCENKQHIFVYNLVLSQ